MKSGSHDRHAWPPTRGRRADGGDLPSILIACGGQRVIVLEELVGAVYQVNFQASPPATKTSVKV